jgi:hypothetical protein
VIDSHNATIQLVGVLADETVDLKLLGTDGTIEFTTITIIIITTDIIIIIITIIDCSYSLSCSKISSFSILGFSVKLICGILMDLCAPQGLRVVNKPTEKFTASWVGRKFLACGL